MKFNSQICTTREQSKRLIALGLKKETADMAYLWYGRAEDDTPLLMDKPSIVHQGIMTTHDLPAWSLHRLIDLCPISIRHMGYHYSLIYDIHRDWVVYMLYANGNNKPYNQHLQGFQNCNRYDAFIDCIEWLIKKGYFPKEYLVDLTGTDSHQDMVDAFDIQSYPFERRRTRKVHERTC